MGETLWVIQRTNADIYYYKGLKNIRFFYWNLEMVCFKLLGWKYVFFNSYFKKYNISYVLFFMFPYRPP